MELVGVRVNIWTEGNEYDARDVDNCDLILFDGGTVESLDDLECDEIEFRVERDDYPIVEMRCDKYYVKSTKEIATLKFTPLAETDMENDSVISDYSTVSGYFEIFEPHAERLVEIGRSLIEGLNKQPRTYRSTYHFVAAYEVHIEPQNDGDVTFELLGRLDLNTLKVVE